MIKENRAQRRARERKKVTESEWVGVRFLLSPAEAEVVEEALTLWEHETRKLFHDMGTEPNDDQTWALMRAEKVRRAISAALENRPYKELHPDREPPAAPSG